MSNITYMKGDGTPQIIADAMDALQNPETPVEDKAAIYGVLSAIVKRVQKALGTYVRSGPTAKSELIAHLIANDIEELGPLYLRWEAFDVAYPCNSADNWTDDGVQEAMAAMHGDRETAPYVRLVPRHYEIDVAALGQAVHDGSLTARALFGELKDKGWRTEGGKRPALKVREIKGKAA